MSARSGPELVLVDDQGRTRHLGYVSTDDARFIAEARVKNADEQHVPVDRIKVRRAA